MVCIYCDSDTDIINSRLQKRVNNVWRRRHCQSCGAVFTTIEAMDLSYSVNFKAPDKPSEPFSRDKLFISIFESCRHRQSPEQDATALTSTVMSKLKPLFAKAQVSRADLTKTTLQVLIKFDRAAASYYQAYHQ